MIEDINGIAAMRLDDSGPCLGSSANASELIGELYGQGADAIVIPVRRLDPEFFRLSSGLAGEFIQKLQNYGYRLAIAGDVSKWTDASAPLRDFVHETNRRGHHLFVADDAELKEKLR